MTMTRRNVFTLSPCALLVALALVPGCAGPCGCNEAALTAVTIELLQSQGVQVQGADFEFDESVFGDDKFKLDVRIPNPDPPPSQLTTTYSGTYDKKGDTITFMFTGAAVSPLIQNGVIYTLTCDKETKTLTLTSPNITIPIIFKCP